MTVTAERTDVMTIDIKCDQCRLPAIRVVIGKDREARLDHEVTRGHYQELDTVFCRDCATDLDRGIREHQRMVAHAA